MSCIILNAQIPEALIGNWINEKTNEWEYGFFEEFAIYENDFWEYESINLKGEKTILVLKKGEQTVLLDIEKNNIKDLLNIKNGKNKAQQYIMAGKSYPDYPVKDDTQFATPSFIQDSVTIKGYYRNFDKIPEMFKQYYGGASVVIAIDDYVTGNDRDYITNIDTMGRFSITVPIVNAQETYFDWRRINKKLILEPGNDLFVFADINDILPVEGESWELRRERPKQILCMGKNARINNEMIKYTAPLNLDINTREDSVKNMSHTDYLTFCKDNYDKRMQYLNEYIAKHPAISGKFKFYQTELEKYQTACYLMQRRFSLKIYAGERFPDGYMEYVSETFPITDERVFTLFRDFRWFLRDYVGYLSEKTPQFVITNFGWFLSDYVGYLSEKTPQFVIIDLNMVSEKLEKEGKIADEIREDVAKFNDFQQKYESLTDSLEKVKYVESQSDFLEKINNYLNNTLIKETIQLISRNFSLETEIKSIDTLITNPHLKELYTSSIYYRMLDDSRLPLDNAEMKAFDERIKTPYLRKTLLDINEYYTSVNKKVMEHEESLINTSYLESVTEYDELFRQLTEKYKGKVIYLDFWGTWCGPCRENMALMGDIKEALSGKNVIFMYLANNSPDRTWRNVIKEMKLTGENIVHYNLPGKQQALLEKHLSVNSFPTYMLIDRNGNIVNSKAPSPREKEKLVYEIEQLLNARNF